MGLNLPKPVAAFYAAEKNQDFGALGQCFSENGRVRDEGRTYQGRQAIAQWMREAKGKYGHTTEPLRVSEGEGKVVVTARVAGSFPGSPIELAQDFELAGDEIAALKIG